KADEIGAAGDELGKLKQQGSLSTAHAWTRMSLSWKILLYSVRCFQDCTYKAILHAQQQGVGSRASMSTCAPDDIWRSGAGVGKLIAEHLPGYPEWFIRTRKADEIGAAGDELGKLKQQGSLSTAHAWTRMSLSWKILLYSVRCFQDCTYKAILHAQQQGVGSRASMSTCAPDDIWRSGAGVGKLIAEHLPGYPEWFIRTRKLRNKLKQGLSVQSVWKGREHFIVLCGKRWNGPYVENTEAHPLKFEFATECLEMCAAVANLIPVALNETRVRKQARALRMKEREVDLSLGSEHSADLANGS
uniref:hypothetical protein n=1 Tax=Cupriavidus sp. 2SB TaxID=2502199 RepID=UPI0014851D9D